MCDDTEAMIEIWKDLGATIKNTNRGLEIIGTKGRLHLKREEKFFARQLMSLLLI